MKQNVMIISANQYRITNDAGKVESEGCVLRYLFTEDLAPFVDNAKGVKGYRPGKANIPYSDFGKLTTVPAIYEVTMSTKIDSQGVVSLIPTEFKLLAEISVNKPTLGAKTGFASKE